MELKINESKVLEFNTVIEGGNASDLSGKLRISIDDVEYGFPVDLNGKKIQVRIPPLKDYVKEHINGRKDYSSGMWALLILELWHQRFID